jgi:hypothetical protein
VRQNKGIIYGLNYGEEEEGEDEIVEYESFFID